MGAQGHGINQNILFQDNQSAIETEKNRKELCTGNSSHIDIRYLFVKYRVESNNTSITYCSAEHMLAYFFTKSLQGALFVIFCGVITGWKHQYNLQMGHPSTKEYVGNVAKVE